MMMRARHLLGTLGLCLLVAATGRAQSGTDDARIQAGLRRAESLERAGQLEQALDLVDDVLAVAPAQPRAILIAERIHRERGDLEALVPIVERARHADPNSVLVRQLELRLLADLGREEAVRAAGERWVQERPRSATAYREYAAVLRRLGALSDAEAVLLRGRRELDRVDVLGPALADLYLDQGRWSAAAGTWVAILEASPSMGYDLVVHKLSVLGPRSEPVAAPLAEALAELDGPVEALMLRAVAALHADRPEAARRAASRAFPRLGMDARRAFADRLARTAADRSQPSIVAWAYGRLLRDAPDDSTRLALARRVVRFDLTARDTAAALEVLDGLLDEAEPGSASHRWASALAIRIRATAAELDRARDLLTNHRRLYPGHGELPALVLAVAEADLRAGDVEKAEAVVEAVAAELEGGSPAMARLHALRGYLALYRGDADLSAERLSAAAELLTGEDRRELLRLLGMVRTAGPGEVSAIADAHRASMQGRWLEAYEALLEGADGVDASAARPSMLLWAGELAERGGAVERAEAALRRIPDRYPRAAEAPVALMKLAELLAATHREPAAIDLLESLILEYPESALTPLARRRLAE